MIPIAELKAALKIPATETTEDAYLEGLDAAAVAFVEKTTGRYFGPGTARVEYFEGTGQKTLWLADAPTGAVTVTADGVAVAADQFEVRGRQLRHVSAWGSGYVPADMKVEYPAGYPAGNEPADIRQAVLELVAKMYEYRTPVITGTIVAEVPHSVRETLQVWRRIP